MTDIELFEKLKLILKDGFEFDDLDKKVKIGPYSENIDSFEKKVKAILGSEYDVDPVGGGRWRIAPGHIRYDGKTIGIDRYGQLQVIGATDEEEVKLDELVEEVKDLKQTMADQDRNLYKTRRTLYRFMRDTRERLEVIERRLQRRP